MIYYILGIIGGIVTVIIAYQFILLPLIGWLVPLRITIRLYMLKQLCQAFEKGSVYGALQPPIKEIANYIAETSKVYTSVDGESAIRVYCNTGRKSPLGY